jgi:hypothetical protein
MVPGTPRGPILTDDARKAPAEGVLAGLDGRHRARRGDGQELLAILGRALCIGIQGPSQRLVAEPGIGEDGVGMGLDHVDRRTAAVGGEGPAHQAGILDDCRFAGHTVLRADVAQTLRCANEMDCQARPKSQH